MNSINNIPTIYDLTLTISADILFSVLSEAYPYSELTSEELSQKQLFLEYFKTGVADIFKEDKRFFVDNEHDSSKLPWDRLSESEKAKISEKAGIPGKHIHSDSHYIALYAKNELGFVLNKWIVDLKTTDHRAKMKVGDSNSTDATTDDPRTAYLNSDEYKDKLQISNNLADNMDVVPETIVVSCGTTFDSNVHINIRNRKNINCKNVDEAIKQIKIYANELWNDCNSNITSYLYNDYRADFKSGIFIVHDDIGNLIEPDTPFRSLEEVKEFIIKDSKGKTFSPIYGSDMSVTDEDDFDIYEFAEDVIDELNSRISDPGYYFNYRDVWYEDGRTMLNIDVIDSESYHAVTSKLIQYDRLVSDVVYREYCLNYIVDDIIDIYSDEEF